MPLLKQNKKTKAAHLQDQGDAEKCAWLQLSRTENVGPITFYKFIECYGSAQKALEAIPDLAARGGRKKPLKVPPLPAIEQEYERLTKAGGSILCAFEDRYPLPLSALEDAPPVISVLGNTDLLDQQSIAIVGSRNASLNGRKFAEILARDLGQAGQVISSGLARGIDTAAHYGALHTGTIAVVAGGIDVIYPQENRNLYEEISEKGLIIAESPLGMPPRAQDFPRRNRIVSGLSAGVIVVEANTRSGSLITARLAGEQGRDVYAVPGHPMDPRAQGTNKLIRDGAVLIRDARDVLDGLENFSGLGGFRDNARQVFPQYDEWPALYDDREEETNDALPDTNSFDAARADILSTLSYTPTDLDELVRHTGISVPLAQTVLLELELAGHVQRLTGNRIVLLQQ